ncbi:hypothetical protein BH09BAC1_BH09BAC1_03180 [soil metagenome]
MKLTPINPHFNACDQKWELMPEQEHDGRLCEACERMLVDFTPLSEQQMLNQQKDNNYKLCGRYTKSQVDRLHRHLAMEESQSKRPWLVAMAMGMGSLLPLGVAAQGDATVSDSTAVLEPMKERRYMKGLAEEVVEVEIIEPLVKKERKKDVAQDSIFIPINQSIPLPGVPCGLTYPLLVPNNSLFIIEGTVTDEETGEVLFGVNVYNQYLKMGASTDMEGKYRIEVPKDSMIYTVLFSYIGYERQEVEVAPSEETTKLNIALETAHLTGLTIMVGGPMQMMPPKKGLHWFSPARWYRRIKYRIQQ